LTVSLANRLVATPVAEGLRRRFLSYFRKRVARIKRREREMDLILVREESRKREMVDDDVISRAPWVEELL